MNGMFSGLMNPAMVNPAILNREMMQRAGMQQPQAMPHGMPQTLSPYHLAMLRMMMNSPEFAARFGGGAGRMQPMPPQRPPIPPIPPQVGRPSIRPNIRPDQMGARGMMPGLMSGLVRR